MGIRDYFLLQRHLYHATAKEIKRYQQKRFLHLLALVRNKSPYYRERYGGLSIRGLDDLPLLPPINKQEMMSHFDELNTCGLRLQDVMPYAVEKERNRDYLGYYLNQYVIGLSSGTSGNKGLYVTPRALTKRLPSVFLARGGIPLSLLPFRILFLLRVFSQGFSDIRAPLIHLSYLSTMTPVEEILDALRKERINILMAPPSLIRVLLPAAHLIQTRLKRIVCYAEVLEKEEKERFMRAFQCPVVEIYQASEGQIASSCRHGNLHINEDLVLVELLDADGRPVTEPGITAARMLVTNLVNEAQPLIRYEMNDLVVLDTPCPCGSCFRTVRQILGRRDDVLWLTDTAGKPRHVFPDLVSRWIITTTDDIREFRVTQTAHRTLEVEVDLFSSTGEAGTTHAANQAGKVEELLQTRLMEEFAAFGIQPDLRIRMVRLPLPPDRSKYKRFIRNTTEPDPEQESTMHIRHGIIKEPNRGG
jgi:putative adenylate-forming enzyme